jgi:hypothetical protein
MKRKLILLVGLALGYVIGARAGREKYDRLKAAAERYWGDPRVTKVRGDVESYARTQAPIIRDRAETVAKDVATKTAATAKDVASKTSATAKDIADKTSATAKDVASKTTATAKDLADKTSATARDLADKTSATANDVRGQVVKTATDIKDRGEDAVERATLSVGEARDRALELDDDEDDDVQPEGAAK